MIRAFCDHRNQVIVPREQGWEDGYGTEGNSSYAGRFNTAGCAAETGIPTVCKVGHTDTQSVDADGESISDRRNHLLYRTGNSELYRKCAGDGSADFRKLVFPASGILSVVLTAFHIYPKIAKWGGAGALVPITGFANSVTAPAVEYQKEGQVFGIGCKIFTIAGPVILYGIFSSWGLGLILWVLQMFGIRVG